MPNEPTEDHIRAANEVMSGESMLHVKSHEFEARWTERRNEVARLLAAHFPVEAHAPATPATLDDDQCKLVAWGTECFGAEHMADPKVRALRLLEEAIEFAQAVDAPADQCAKLVEYVYSRPIGKPEQELGGIGVTWLVAAAAIGKGALEALHCEMTRIAQKTPSHFAQRNQQKLDAGFTAVAEAAPTADPRQLMSEMWSLVGFLASCARAGEKLNDEDERNLESLRTKYRDYKSSLPSPPAGQGRGE